MLERDDLELLGLTDGERVTHDQLRRAYLRRLRVHSPERDPDGFRRLREAFERLEPWARFQDEMRAAAAARAEAAIVDDAGPATGEARAGAAVERAPATAAASDEREPARAAPLPKPDEATDDATDDAPAELPPAIVVKLGHRGHRTAPSDPPPAPLDARPPATLGSVNKDILVMLQAGERRAARDLAEQWNRSALDDHREVSPLEAQRWALTRELLDVARWLPDPLCRAIAAGIEADDLSVAYAPAEAYRDDHPVEANELAQRLAKRASSLHKAIGGLLQSRGRAQGTAESSGRPGMWLIWIVVVAISSMVRNFDGCDSHPSPGDYRFDPVPSIRRDGPPAPRLVPPLLDQSQLHSPPAGPPAERWYDRKLDPPAGDLDSVRRSDVDGRAAPRQP